MKSSENRKLQDQIETLRQEVLSLTARVVRQRQLEEQLLQANKMKALALLAGGVAHDFNNILQAILGHTQLALLNKTDRDPDYDTFKEIEQIIKKGGELTGQFLAIGRKMRPKLVPLDLNASVNQVQKLFVRTFPKMIEIRLQLADNLAIVKADRGQIEQVLINLCINARDAMAGQGRLTIATENVSDPSKVLGIEAPAGTGYVCLSVSDTGCGIAPENKYRIFEPYFSAKTQKNGTGLGLSMVSAIAKNHGGVIECSSIVGVGTEFRIFLPVSKHRKFLHKKPADSKDAETGIGGRETILIVDDEAEIRNIGKAILQRHGYHVLTAQNGEDALKLSSDLKIDSVILDVGMPGMGGISCLQKMLAKDGSAKILISSGYVSDDQVETALRQGAKAFLKKPYRINNLLQTVRRVLDEP